MYSYHIHSTFSDGKNTPEEIVTAAIDKGFAAVGFSDHGFTAYDLRYCMKDPVGYINEVERLKEKYKDRIEIYLGVEEDAFHPLRRADFDYTIGSCHYMCKDGEYLPIDSSYDHFKKCLAAYGQDHLVLAESYYSSFCAYIRLRKPDVIGHFDLITKFDELDESLFLQDRKYTEIAEKYLLEAIQSKCIFEVNTGAIARGLRKTVYPFENLLYILKKRGADVILSSDSHSIETLDFAFDDIRKYLKDIGFERLKVLRDREFRDVEI